TIPDRDGHKGKSLFDLLGEHKVSYTRWARWRYTGAPMVVSRYTAWSGSLFAWDSTRYPYDGEGSSSKGLATYLSEENDYWAKAIADMKKKLNAALVKKYEARMESSLTKGRS